MLEIMLEKMEPGQEVFLLPTSELRLVYKLALVQVNRAMTAIKIGSQRLAFPGVFATWLYGEVDGLVCEEIVEIFLLWLWKGMQKYDVILNAGLIDFWLQTRY